MNEEEGKAAHEGIAHSAKRWVVIAEGQSLMNQRQMATAWRRGVWCQPPRCPIDPLKQADRFTSHDYIDRDGSLVVGGHVMEGIVMLGKTTARGLSSAWVAGLLLSVSGCASWVGDMGPVGKASDLAIDCKTDESLAQINSVPFEKNLASAMGDLTRIVILRDAGRTAEAQAALAERNTHWHVDEKGAAESEKSISETVEKIREERLKKTGKRTCH